eukprot:CAMPEP_0203953446 /NCGR_PEP_ID=MMETSP0359-20131031/86812_1 /ASSEMBLY_ACC=CAM_ASM_000338 /TAXON_ID=268821 /ORGANISM="Scrippsiella Hangoei, Strain SHTV-5" /LENGTH=119 /DNA_ID=CAMNT_0050886757 /DNA_START=45 /DNA_END=401 /DNA_ORIENTATION=-
MAEDWSRFTPSSVDPDRCKARTWNGGAGGQCTAKKDATGFCKMHGTGDKWKVHGAVDGPIPEKKLREFVKAGLAGGAAGLPRSPPSKRGRPAGSGSAAALPPPTKRQKSAAAEPSGAAA